MNEDYKYSPEQLKSAEKLFRLFAQMSEDKQEIIITRTSSFMAYIEKQENPMKNLTSPHLAVSECDAC